MLFKKYQPSKEILSKYADVLVNFALNSGKGVKKGEVVLIQVPECAKPILLSLRRAVLKARAHPIIEYLPDDISREYYELAEEHHLSFFPFKLMRGKVDEIDHSITILAETNKKELEGIDPKKIMRKQIAFKPYRDWRTEKENKGKFTWTLALYGTDAMAKEAGLTLKEYWNQIIKACYLDYPRPIEKWKSSFDEIERIKNKLNSMKIEKLHVKSQNTDLIVGLGDKRLWMGGSGRNIPSFELFISPDWRKTSGKIFFNQPLYRYGNLIKDVYLEFKDGRVIKATAKKGQPILKEMISVKNADKIGEFSLTDIRFSKINRFMAETLFDENFGGNFGNTHLALGEAYKDSYPGNPSNMTKKQWDKLGYNESVIHTDIISTENRIVTAFLKSGKQVVIYKNGMFTV
jgi:aminopeptidase